MLITVSGPPGSGTTTLSERVAARLELALVPGGAVFREMARERGMSLPEFGLYAADHPQIDVELDTRLAKRAGDGGAVIESRLAGWIARNEGLPAVTAYLECAAEVRAARVAEREGLDPARALADNLERERVERGRYLALYGIDVDDLGVYDLVLDSAILSPDELADRVVAEAHRRFG